MIRVLAATLLLSLPLVAAAGEEISGSNILLAEYSNWKTGENSGYWMFEGEGVQLSEGDPEGGRPIECHGAGYWDEDGSWGEGICIIGIEEDTLVTSWKRDKEQTIGQWVYLSGTGKFEGVEGQGTYESIDLPGDRQIAKWQGEMTLPE